MSYGEALRRVEQLKARGIWTGITGPDADGLYWLAHDPGDGAQDGGAR